MKKEEAKNELIRLKTNLMLELKKDDSRIQFLPDRRLLTIYTDYRTKLLYSQGWQLSNN